MYIEKRILGGPIIGVMTAFHYCTYIQTGVTPLRSASLRGHAAVVELLLLNGADVSICDEVRTYIIIVHTLLLVLLLYTCTSRTHKT